MILQVQAYVHFAHALKLESNNSAALKGRQAANDFIGESVGGGEFFAERKIIDSEGP